MLDGIPVKDLSLATLLAIAVLLIFLGRLIPSKTYNEKRAEAEHWREAYEKERDAHHTTQSQTLQLMELAKTTHALIAAIVHPSGVDQKSGGSDVAIPPQPGSGI